MHATTARCKFPTMDKIGKRIAQAREKAGMNQSELARALGLTPQSIQKWEAGDTIPRGQRIQELARILRVSVAHLMGAEECEVVPIQGKLAIGQQLARTVDVPLLDVSASMGVGQPQPDGYVEVIERMTINRDWVRQHLVASGPDNLALITGRGDSMEGTFNDGDLLLVDRGVREIRVDAVYVVAIDGELFVKRMQRKPGGGVMMLSDNQKYTPIEIHPATISRFDVLGRVLIAWNERRL